MRDKLIISKLTTGRVRTEVVDGRRYLVAPVVAIKAGVLNTELVPAEEIQKSVKLWNDVPIPIDHPLRNDQEISARDLEIIEKTVVGRFYNAYYEDGKLKGELWIDIEKAKKVGGDALKALEKLQNGEPLEVSTAYYADLSQESGVYQGKQYQAIQHDLRPDHLALLPTGIGACSWQDGCGAPRINQEGGTMETNILGTARTPSYSGVESTPWSGPTLDDMIAGYVKHTGNAKPASSRVADLPQAVKNWIASKTLLGDPKADTTADLIFFPCVNPSTNKLNEGALRAIISGRGAQAKIPAGAKASAQAKARSLLEKEFGMATQEDKLVSKIISKIKEVLGVNTMNEKERLIEKLHANGVELEGLENMDEKVLQWMVEHSAQPQEATPEPAPAENSKEEKPEVNEDKVGVTINEYLKSKGTDLEKVLEHMKAEEAKANKERQELIASLVSNKQCMVSKENLEKMETTALRQLAATFEPGNYLGIGVPRKEPEAVPAPPAIVLNTEEGEK